MGVHQNWVQVFGRNPLMWPLPFFGMTGKPVGDGVAWIASSNEGSLRLGGISRLYCRDANGALVVSDISNERTIDRAISWKSQVDDHVRMPDGSRIPMVLCVNKYDLCNPAEAMSEAALQRIVVQNEFASGFFTSAMSSFNVENAFHKLVEEVLSRSSPDIEDEPTSNTRVARLSIPLFTDDRKLKPQKCC
jgi:GTPase SAR1 family protein